MVFLCGRLVLFGLSRDSGWVEKRFSLAILHYSRFDATSLFLGLLSRLCGCSWIRRSDIVDLFLLHCLGGLRRQIRRSILD
jgi:hypothetical protein